MPLRGARRVACARRRNHWRHFPGGHGCPVIGDNIWKLKRLQTLYWL